MEAVSRPGSFDVETYPGPKPKVSPNRAATALLGVIATLLVASASTSMAVEPPQGYVCEKTTGAIKIDGKLDEADWAEGHLSGDFIDIEGPAKPKPRFGTKVQMIWDDEYFYIGAHLEEPHVWATLTEHDSVIFADNDFEVFIDPDGDNLEYTEFELNALNTEWDLLLRKPYRDGGPAENSLELPGLKTAVHVDGTLNDPSDIDRGWTVEIAIPWKTLAEHANRPSPPKQGEQWRVNFSRVEWITNIVDGKYRKLPKHREDNWVWSPQFVVDMHRPERWGYVQFATGPRGATPFKPDPTGPARDRLISVYQAERAYHKANDGRWAGSIEQLGLSKDVCDPSKPITLQLTEKGFEATVETPTADGASKKLHIRQDSRIWLD
ncbi:carbohydrate-binding family 9-like protein [Singulisphaera rosea]